MSDVPTTTSINAKTNLPLFTLGAAVILIALLILALIFIPARNQLTTDLLVTSVMGSIPGLIAAAYSERNSRDMRNGVVEQKVKDGATKALKETGVTDVVEASGRGASSAAAVEALTASTRALTGLLTAQQPLVQTATAQEPTVQGPTAIPGAATDALG